MKSTVLLIVLSCAVATTLASYEQFVSEAIDEAWTYGLRESRHRRDLENKNDETSDVETTPTTRKPVWCFCGKTDWMKTFTKKNQDIIETCDKEVPSVQENQKDNSENSSTPAFSSGLCKMECMFKKLNFLNSEGNLDKSAVKTYFMDSIFVEDWMPNIAGKVVDHCLNNGTNIDPLLSEAAQLETAKGRYTCKNDPYNLCICLLLGMAINCPADQQSKDLGCHKLQSVVDTLKKEHTNSTMTRLYNSFEK